MAILLCNLLWARIAIMQPIIKYSYNLILALAARLRSGYVAIIYQIVIMPVYQYQKVLVEIALY